MDKLLAAMRTSEFWVSIATGLGQLGVVANWWTQESFNTVLMPAIVYVVGRVTSKAVKAGA